MKVVLQRVSSAAVSVEGKEVSSIQMGFLVLVGIEKEDGLEDLRWLSRKITQMRVFRDENGRMNAALKEVDGALLVVSQFTLQASTKKGNRPSYVKAADPSISMPLYEAFVAQLEQDMGRSVQTGIFGADMQVSSVNDGPVTLVIDSKLKR
jgi:D-tyrosyl-tRNA(Tyr) deacylase